MKVVVIGGGTGTYTVLSGLKKKEGVDITAIVSMFDNGGSTGILRDEFGVLPPGDVRKCLIALSQESVILRRLFSYRFDKGYGLSGHSLGNLFLTALNNITGDDNEAIKQAAKILNVKGRVLPVSLDDCQVHALLEDGTVIKGENNIDVPKHNGLLKIKDVFLEPKAYANNDAIDAILSADLIVVGPGDLYTSVVPNLVVKGISDAINRSSAKKVYVCNLMTKFGETHSYGVKEHVDEIEKYVHVDKVLVSSYGDVPQNILLRYEQQNSFRVSMNLEDDRVVLKNLLKMPNLIRHDSDKLAEELLNF